MNVGKVVLGSNYEGASSRHINIEFNGKKIVEDIVVNLSPGKIVAISGPSGSGKTSILRELCGLVEGDSSTEYGKGTIGWVAQDFSAITSSVANEIALLHIYMKIVRLMKWRWQKGLVCKMFCSSIQIP